MKKILILISLFAGCTPKPDPVEPPHWSAVELLRNQHKDELSEWDKLIMAICWTESKFDPDAIGKNQDSGIMQITPIFVAEVNRLYGTAYTIADAFDIDKSLELYRLMQAHYNPKNDIETAIRYHNRSESYKRVVLENLAMIERMETLRTKLKKK